MQLSIKEGKITWVEIKNPVEEDIDWLKKKFNLHPLVLKELLPRLDYPKIEIFGDYIFLVLFYPFFNKETCQTIPFELDLIVAKDYLITSHYKDIVPLKAIFDKCNLYEDFRKEVFSQGTAYILYLLLQEILNASFPKLSHIKWNIEKIEKEIYQRQNKDTVAGISLITRDIIGFQRVLEPQKLILERLKKAAEKIFGEKFLPYFSELINLHEEINGLLKTLKNTLSALDSTNSSLLNTKTNEIIKILTIFSVILLPLTLITSLFNINTQFLPLVNNPAVFWIILGAMAFLATAMSIFFKIKKWI